MALPPVRLTLALFLLAHLGLALAVPLVNDEAYYALWARWPAAGYFDHPPLVAWMIALGERVLGHNRLGVRILPVLAWTATIPIVAAIAARLGGDMRQRRAAALFMATGLLPSLLGSAATPDAGSVLFWAATVLALTHVQDRPRAWLWVGLWAGLGVLAKFTNLFLGLGLLAWIAWDKRGRRHLASPWPWAGGALALAVVSPVIWWNIAHDGLGLVRQFGRIGAGRFDPADPALFVALLLVVASPPVAWAALRALPRLPVAARLLVPLHLPLVLYFAWHATGASVQANWLAPMLVPLAVLGGLWAGAHWRGALIWTAAGLGLGPAALLLGLGLWPGPPLLGGGTQADQTKGWPAFAAAIEARARQGGATWIATMDYGTTGQLTFQRLGLPVHDLGEPYRYVFRPPLDSALCAAPALLVTPQRGKAPDPARVFARVGPSEQLARLSRGSPVQAYDLQIVQGLLTCPPDRSAAAARARRR